MAVLACYDHKALMGDGKHVGHVSPVEMADPMLNRMSLVETESGRRVVVDGDQLFSSMHWHQGGLLMLCATEVEPVTEAV